MSRTAVTVNSYEEPRNSILAPSTPSIAVPDLNKSDNDNINDVSVNVNVKFAPKTNWFLIGLIYMAMIGDMVSSSLSGPFAPQWLVDDTSKGGLGLPENLKGLYSGLLSGLYPFANALSSPLLGYWSDSHGRKSVLVGGLLSAALFSFTMIAIPNPATAFISRSLAGFCDGSQGITYAMIGDLTAGNPQDRTMAFAYAMAAFQVARVGSSSLGGYLVNVADFSVDPSKSNYYLLPAFISSVFLVITAIMIAIFLRETNLHTKLSSQQEEERARRLTHVKTNRLETSTDSAGSINEDKREPLLDRPSDAPAPAPAPSSSSFRDRFLSVWRNGLLVRVIFVYSIVNGCNGAFLVLVPLQAEQKGSLGYSMSTGSVGLILSIFAAWAFIFQITLFKLVVAKLGLVTANNVGTVLMAIATVLFPLGVYMDIPPLVIIIISMGVAGAGYMLCSSLLTTMSSNLTAPELHGTVQGWSRSVANVFRGVGPFAAGALWSASVDYPSVSFAVVAAGYFLCFLLMFRIPNEAVAKQEKKAGEH